MYLSCPLGLIPTRLSARRCRRNKRRQDADIKLQRTYAVPFPLPPFGGILNIITLPGLTSNTNIPIDERYVYEPIPAGGEYIRLLERTPGHTEPLYS
ncbi:hypothetical protein OCU04_005938 [Sclerotinia nivalis]|uniref:Uncharacterized protein n=1 Tax=Sclerotinia nivalis TaxID=352851 RepID=A0A9X0AQF4_9HELO|nr:hypothetical protein OCU04_005938 [Sclerotinia nivalis]